MEQDTGQEGAVWYIRLFYVNLLCIFWFVLVCLFCCVPHPYPLQCSHSLDTIPEPSAKALSVVGLEVYAVMPGFFFCSVAWHGLRQDLTVEPWLTWTYHVDNASLKLQKIRLPLPP